MSSTIEEIAVVDAIDESTTMSPEVAVQTVIDVLFYEDQVLKPLTHDTIQSLKVYKRYLNEGDALLIDGVTGQYNKDMNSRFEIFKPAEDKGSEHPLLYHSLGKCYQDPEARVTLSYENALGYYVKSISGTPVSACPFFLFRPLPLSGLSLSGVSV